MLAGHPAIDRGGFRVAVFRVQHVARTPTDGLVRRRLEQLLAVWTPISDRSASSLKVASMVSRWASPPARLCASRTTGSSSESGAAGACASDVTVNVSSSGGMAAGKSCPLFRRGGSQSTKRVPALSAPSRRCPCGEQAAQTAVPCLPHRTHGVAGRLALGGDGAVLTAERGRQLAGPTYLRQERERGSHRRSFRSARLLFADR